MLAMLTAVRVFQPVQVRDQQVAAMRPRPDQGLDIGDGSRFWLAPLEPGLLAEAAPQLINGGNGNNGCCGCSGDAHFVNWVRGEGSARSNRGRTGGREYHAGPLPSRADRLPKY